MILDKPTKRALIFVIIFAMLWVTYFFIKVKNENQLLQKDGVQATARIIRVSISYGSSSSVVEYEYFVNKVRLIGSLPAQILCSSYTIDQKKSLVNQYLPIIYSSSQPDVCVPLINQSRALEYDVIIPDSLRQFVLNTFDCNSPSSPNE